MNQIVFRRAGIQDIPSLTELRILQLLEEGTKPFVDLHTPLHNYYEKHLSDGSFIACLAENSKQIVAVGGYLSWKNHRILPTPPEKSACFPVCTQ